MTNSTVYTNTKSNISEIRAAIYCRLSKDDELSGESASIQNQRELLRRYCDEQGFTITREFQDDGYSGLSMNRPGFQEMLEAAKNGEFDVCLTKDMSRLSRNYIDSGYLTESFFPKNHIRYIALNDAVDSRFENELVPFRAVLNELYSRDVSKKVHSSYLTKAKSGKFTGCLAPFGYMKSPDDKNKLIIDEETAWIVRKIYGYAAEGRGPNYIRRKLEDERIPCPAWWNRQKGLRNHVTKFEREDAENGRFIWDFTVIQEMLANPVYIGTIASQKSEYRFKTGWLGDKKPEDWICVENVHEPIIDRDTFELVQNKVKERKRPDAWGNYSIFAGIVKCGQCGSSMNIRRANQKGNDRIYTCSRYNKFGVAHCSQHRIKYDTLYDIVLEQIRACAKKALSNESDVLDELCEQTKVNASSEQELIRRSITEDETRIGELERVIGKLYEDMVTGRITEDNFNRILEKSQSEQASLKTRVELNSSRLEKRSKEREDSAKWRELIAEYADIRELDAVTLNRLIRKIVIHEDTDGEVVRQTVEIHFNFRDGSDEAKIPQN